jgi:hypothetical protein
VFYFVVHGNGAVELRPVDDEPATESRLPPRVGDQGETQATRRIFTIRRRKRPIGGYAPFEKSRSYLGVFALWTILGLGSVAAAWYVKQVYTITEARGRKGTDAWQSQDEDKRRIFQEKQKRALAKAKVQWAKAQVQPATAKVEAGRQPADQTPPD